MAEENQNKWLLRKTFPLFSNNVNINGDCMEGILSYILSEFLKNEKDLMVLCCK